MQIPGSGGQDCGGPVLNKMGRNVVDGAAAYLGQTCCVVVSSSPLTQEVVGSSLGGITTKETIDLHCDVNNWCYVTNHHFEISWNIRNRSNLDLFPVEITGIIKAIYSNKPYRKFAEL